MGSPIVFHTAPPQPASKARITWPAVLVGGPEASQNGFGDRTPQKLMLRSGISAPLQAGFLQRLVDPGSGFFAIRDCVHHFLSAIDAIPSSKIARMAALHGLRIYSYTSRLQLYSGNFLQKLDFALLSQRLHYHFNRKPEFAADDGLRTAAPGNIRLSQPSLNALQGFYAAIAEHSHRLGLPQKSDRIFLRQLIFVIEC